MAAMADGSREMNSLTVPPLKSFAKTAMSHARKGGLNGMSVPHDTGRIQSPD